MKFNREIDVRRWAIKSEWTDCALVWIENKSGGTVGATDLVVVKGEQAAWLELKLAWMCVTGAIRVKAQASQRVFHRQLERVGANIQFVAGLKNTDRLIRFRWDDMRLVGQKEVSKVQRESVFEVVRWDFVDGGWSPVG